MGGPLGLIQVLKSESVKLDGPKVLKWTVQTYSTWRFKNIEPSMHFNPNFILPLTVPLPLFHTNPNCFLVGDLTCHKHPKFVQNTWSSISVTKIDLTLRSFRPSTFIPVNLPVLIFFGPSVFWTVHFQSFRPFTSILSDRPIRAFWTVYFYSFWPSSFLP